MKNSVFTKAAAVTAGLATVLTLTAGAPAFAKPKIQSNGASHSHAQHVAKPKSAIKPKADHPAKPVASSVATATQAFTVTNVPASFTSADELGRVVGFKVVVLPADATVAPAVLPAEPGKGDGRGKPIKNLVDPSDTNAPAVLATGTLSGNLYIKAGRVAGVTNLGIYPMVRADEKTGLAAQSGTPVFVVRTTAVDGSVTLSGQSGPVTLDLGLNTGTILAPQTATVVVPSDGKTYQLEITNADGKLVRIVAVTGVGTVTVNLPRLKPGSYSIALVAQTATGTFTIGDNGALGGPLNLG